MAKTDYSVVRNEGNMRSAFTTRERHNERKNEIYGNGDVVPERTHLNVHFRQHFRADGTVEGYEETYNRLLSEGIISEKWQKPESKAFDEMVFDVNTDFFERNGGYDYAKKFFEEAYRCAVKEVGGEQYILSAVLHADERNKALSEQLGRDVYHYHLHVVYVPVVKKREYFRKKKDEPEDAPRKLKAVYAQVSHAKKWPLKVEVERGEKTIMLNSYSLLQDRFYDHMKIAGFEGFERGEYGSTKEHLDALDFKIQQEMKRLAALEKQAEKKEAKLVKLDEKITVKEKAKATLAEVDAMGKSAVFGGVNFTDEEAKKLKSLAKKGVGVDKRAEEYKNKITTLEGDIRSLNNQINSLHDDVRTIARDRDTWKANYERLWGEVKDFIQAIRRMPQKLLGFIHEHISKSNNQEVSR